MRARLAASIAGGVDMRGIQMNTLMRAIPARDVAQLAADAFLFMNARDDLEIRD